MEQKMYSSEEMIIDDLHEGVRELGELTTDTATRLGEKAISAIRRLERAIPNIKERVSGWKNDLGDQARDAGQKIDQYAKKNPWQLMGVALGTGLLLGILLSGGSDDSE